MEREQIIADAIAAWRAAGSPDHVWRMNGATFHDKGLLAAWRAADKALCAADMSVATIGEVRAVYTAWRTH